MDTQDDPNSCLRQGPDAPTLTNAMPNLPTGHNNPSLSVQTFRVPASPNFSEMLLLVIPQDFQPIPDNAALGQRLRLAATAFIETINMPNQEGPKGLLHF